MTDQPPAELLPLSKHERVNWPVWLKQGEIHMRRQMPTSASAYDYAVNQIYRNRNHP